MWPHFADRFRCPLCSGGLDLRVFQDQSISVTAECAALAADRGLIADSWDRYVNSGVLLCSTCHVYYPIFRGVPVFTLYVTPIHRHFVADFKKPLSSFTAGYNLANAEPPKGERF